MAITVLAPLPRHLQANHSVHITVHPISSRPKTRPAQPLALLRPCGGGMVRHGRELTLLSDVTVDIHETFQDTATCVRGGIMLREQARHVIVHRHQQTGGSHRPGLPRARPLQHKHAATEAPLQLLPDAAQHAHPRKRITRKGVVLDMRPAVLVRPRGVQVLLLPGGGLLGARGAAEGHDKVPGRRPEGVHLQPRGPLGGDVGVELAEDVRRAGRACVVGHQDGAAGLVVEEGCADLGVETAGAGAREEAVEPAMEEVGDEVEGEAVCRRVDSYD